MATGSVKWFNHAKGFGFIVQEDETDLYVHSTGLIDRQFVLRPGDTVEYNLAEDARGPHATAVRLVNRADGEEVEGGRGRGDLAQDLEGLAVRLSRTSAAVAERGRLGPTAAYELARSLRHMANRLNPPAV